MMNVQKILSIICKKKPIEEEKNELAKMNQEMKDRQLIHREINADWIGKEFY